MLSRVYSSCHGNEVVLGGVGGLSSVAVRRCVHEEGGGHVHPVCVCVCVCACV